jgi:hypothetical protein
MWTKIIISVVVGSVLAWVLSFGATEVLIRDFPEEEGSDFPRPRQDINHGHAYSICALIVFACAVPIGLNIPIFQKDTDTFNRILYTFVAIFIPALIGVWCALPRKAKI